MVIGRVRLPIECGTLSRNVPQLYCLNDKEASSHSVVATDTVVCTDKKIHIIRFSIVFKKCVPYEDIA